MAIIIVKDRLACEICKNPKHILARFCKRCKKILDRVDTRGKVNKKARMDALKRAWNGGVFLCHYSRIQLVEDDPKSPCYITFDHRTPRQKDEINP